MTKRIFWIGQRMYDGLIYSKLIPEIDVLFCCDSCTDDSSLKDRLRVFSLQRATGISRKWSCADISLIIAQFKEEIAQLLSVGYSVLPYDFPAKSELFQRYENSIYNSDVISSSLLRIETLQVMSNSGLATINNYVPTTGNVDLVRRNDRFVAQYDNSSSGEGTYLLASAEEYNQLVEAHGRPDLISEYADGIPMTVHLRIDKEKFSVSALSAQIIEPIENDVGKKLTYCGNDFSASKRFCPQVFNAIAAMADKIARAFRRIGIVGLVGVDFILNQDKPLINEVNYRLQNSTAIFASLQPDNNCVLSLVNGISDCVVDLTSFDIFQYTQFSNSDGEKIKSGIYSASGEIIALGLFYPDQLPPHRYIIVSSADKHINAGKYAIKVIGNCESSNVHQQVKSFLANVLLNTNANKEML